MMPGSLPPQSRPPDWLPESDEVLPVKPNFAARLALWDMRTKFFLTIWYRICFFVLSGLGVTALIMVMWWPAKLSATFKLLSPIVSSGRGFIIPSVFLVVAAYASKIVGKFIDQRRNIVE